MLLKKIDDGWKDHSRKMIYKTWKYRQKCGIERGARRERNGSFQRLMIPNEILEKQWPSIKRAVVVSKGSELKAVEREPTRSLHCVLTPTMLSPIHLLSASCISLENHAAAAWWANSREFSTMIYILEKRLKSCGHVKNVRLWETWDKT